MDFIYGDIELHIDAAVMVFTAMLSVVGVVGFRLVGRMEF